jgi:hypothetical protein
MPVIHPYADYRHREERAFPLVRCILCSTLQVFPPSLEISPSHENEFGVMSLNDQRSGDPSVSTPSNTIRPATAPPANEMMALRAGLKKVTRHCLR